MRVLCAVVALVCAVAVLAGDADSVRDAALKHKVSLEVTGATVCQALGQLAKAEKLTLCVTGPAAALTELREWRVREKPMKDVLEAVCKPAALAWQLDAKERKTKDGSKTYTLVLQVRPGQVHPTGQMSLDDVRDFVQEIVDALNGNDNESGCNAERYERDVTHVLDGLATRFSGRQLQVDDLSEEDRVKVLAAYVGALRADEPGLWDRLLYLLKHGGQ